MLAVGGFNVGYYECSQRLKGTTTYTLSRKLSQALNSIVSFSNRPLYYLVGMGVVIFSLSSIGIFLLAIRRLTVQSTPDGWTSLIIVMLAMSGLIIMAIGLVGVYVAKLFEEVKARPNYIIRKIYKADKWSGKSGV